MIDLLFKIAAGRKFDDSDIANALYEMCDDLHASDCDSCIMTQKGFVAKSAACRGGYCPYYKNGAGMLAVLRDTNKD